MIKKITSHINPLIKHVVALHSGTYRQQSQEYIAQGERVISTLIAAHTIPINLFVTEDLVERAKTLVSDDRIVIVADSIIKKMSTTLNPSGMLATFSIPPAPSYDALSTGIVLFELQDPGNVGTLIRTAVAMNKKTAIFINSVDPWNTKVVQASAGAIGMINIFCMSWNDLLVHKQNIPLCALIVSQKNNPRSSNLQNALLVIGNEGAGLPRTVIGECEEKISLAMPGGFESLNAAVAGSIALYITTTAHK
jgi:TrmH family RNA methyltransferase